jgi:hypothetical protein
MDDRIPLGRCATFLTRHVATAFFFVHVAFPIFCGTAIYSLWRSKTLLVFTWYRWADIYAPIMSLRSHVSGFRHLVPGPILFSLPDALWVYSFTAFIQYLWAEQPKCYAKTLWPLLPVALACGAEIGQLFAVVPGTFDPVDLIAYVVAWKAASISVNASIAKSRSRTAEGLYPA